MLILLNKTIYKCINCDIRRKCIIYDLQAKLKIFIYESHITITSPQAVSIFFFVFIFFVLDVMLIQG